MTKEETFAYLVKQISGYRTAIETSVRNTTSEISKVKAQESSGFWIWLTGSSNKPAEMYPEALVMMSRKVSDAYKGWKYGRDVPYTDRLRSYLADFKGGVSVDRANVIIADTSTIRKDYMASLAHFEAVRVYVISWITVIRTAAKQRSEDVRVEAIENGGATFAKVAGEVEDYVYEKVGEGFTEWLKSHPITVACIVLGVYYAFFTPSGRAAMSRAGGATAKGAKWTYEEGKEWGTAALGARHG
jgi:hypothetical protein